jgi:hypothetical protein
MKKHEPLPAELNYLEPFVRFLSKYPADELDESVDPSRLEMALRKRIKGLKPAEAQKLLDDHCGALARLAHLARSA